MICKSNAVQGDSIPFRFKLRKAILIAATACLLVGLGWVLHGELHSHAIPGVTTASSSAAQKHSSPLHELASLVETCVLSSRPILLGSRDPRGSSCVSIVNSGQIVNQNVPALASDLDGGPGTSLMTFYCRDRLKCKTAAEDFNWHQGRLKVCLENQAVSNRPAAESAHQLAERARQFYEAAAAWTAWPDELAPIGFSRNTEWLGYCMTEMDRAVDGKDLAALQRWAGELASAAFSLDDLHRWLGFLVENELAALEFQGRCQTLFALVDEQHEQYEPSVSISYLPGGMLCSQGAGNYYEVERQAERLFSVPYDRMEALRHKEYLTPGSLWIMPRLRGTFLKIQDVLSPENRRTWDKAAQTPYEHAYLINMLFRAEFTGRTEDLCAALKRFDTVHPRATVGELMSAMMYRGHSFAGLEWDDRYQPQLLRAASRIGAADSDEQALLAAHRWTNDFYHGPENYGWNVTLRDALREKKLDCIRATDMIGAIFRGAGRTRFGHVRWCSEKTGHSVAAYLGTENGKNKTLLADGLVAGDRLDVWPDCYFHAHAWPPGLEKNPSPYAVELYVRGLDSYIWAEGYIARGPNAGWLTTAAIPYSTRPQEKATRKVFAGPYPE
jgi:hypothetical protein